jgi:putative ABC transport system substrate-binding protein
LAADDAAGKARIAAFLQEFQLLGWTDGRNVRVDIRWSASHADDIRKYAAELVASFWHKADITRLSSNGCFRG